MRVIDRALPASMDAVQIEINKTLQFLAHEPDTERFRLEVGWYERLCQRRKLIRAGLI